MTDSELSGLPTKPIKRPATLEQVRLWFESELFPENPGYNGAIGYRLAGPIDEQALADAFTALTRRHEALRTTFDTVDGTPVQIVDPEGYTPLQLTDVSSTCDPVAMASRISAELVLAPMNLLIGPLFKAILIRLAEDDHVLVWLSHHTILDGGSISVFEHDLALAYTACLAGQVPFGGSMPMQCGDIAQRQLKWLNSKEAEREGRYWRAKLADLPPVPEVPTSGTRPTSLSGRSEEIVITIPEQVLDTLSQYAREQRTTLFVVMLAAFQVVQSRYTKSDDVVVGTSFSGRQDASSAEVIGMFAKTQVIRTAMIDRPVFRELVLRVRNDVLDAIDNQDYPFHLIVNEQVPVRRPGRQALFHVWFDYLAPRPPLILGGVAAMPWPTGPSLTTMQLAVHVVQERDGRVRCRLNYAPELFDPATLRRLAQHYVRVLTAVADNPEIRVSRIPMVSSAEQGINSPVAVPRPKHRSLCRWFEQQVAATPTATAVIAASRRLTYSELNRRANQLARYLQQRGTRSGSVVGIALPRGAEMVVALLAIFKIGAAVLAIDPDDPADRVRYLIDDAGASVILGCGPETTRMGPVRVIALDSDAVRIAALADTDLASASTVGELACIVYTSGSTGRPKGVALPQRLLSNLIAWYLEWSPVHGPSLQFASLTFDAAYKEIFAALLTGQPLVIADDEDRTDPERLLDLLIRERVTRVPFCPPAILEQVSLAARTRDTLPPLREVHCGGDRLRITPATRHLLKQLPGVLFGNGYGPTETHLAAAHRLAGDPTCWPESPPIGRPITDMRIYLLDAGLEPVPRCVPGEVFVAGFVSWGYVGRPDLTAERFLPDPFGPAGDRMYRTGDLARFSAEGHLEFLGRIDRQLKVRGHRVEPSELEAVLCAHPLVREAVVTTDAADQQQLVAYVVPTDPDMPPRPTELRSQMRRMVPMSLVPSRFAVIPMLPLTSRGKLDYRLLPAPAEALPICEPPQTREESVVARVWQEILGITDISRSDDFFELGGHSLLATKVVLKLRKEFGRALPLRILFDNPTVAELSDALTRVRA